MAPTNTSDLDEIFGDFGDINDEPPFAPAGQPRSASGTVTPPPPPENFEEKVLAAINDWKNTAKQEKERLQADINNRIEALKGLANGQIKTIVDINNRSEVNRSFFDVYDALIARADEIRRYRDAAIRQNASIMNDTKFSTLQAELVAIASLAKNAKVSYSTAPSGGGGWHRTLKISGETEDISLTCPESKETVHFGVYELTVTIQEANGSVTVIPNIRALTPNYPASHLVSNRRDTIHPHVLTGSICMGDARHPIDHAIRDMRISDIFDVLFSLLRTYNPASPFHKLSQWTKVRCPNCGNYSSSEKLSKCCVCNNFRCEQCGKDMIRCSHEGCQTVMCATHLTQGNRIPVAPCIHCGHVFCERHTALKKVHPCCRKSPEELIEAQKKRYDGMKDGLMRMRQLIFDVEGDIFSGQPQPQATPERSHENNLDDIFGDFNGEAHDIFDELSEQTRQEQAARRQAEQQMRLELEEEAARLRQERERQQTEQSFGNTNPTRGWIRT